MGLRRDTIPSPQSTATAASRSSERLVFLAFQCHHWDLARRLPLVIGELRIQLRLFGIEPVSLFTAERRGRGLVGFAPDLDGDFRVGQHVMVPVGVSGCGVLVTTPGTARGEQKQGSAFPDATDLAPL